jgi:hypothetical protein
MRSSEPKVQGSDLYFGNTRASADLLDAVKKHGGEAFIFVKSRDEFVRVATTLTKGDGSSAQSERRSMQIVPQPQSSKMAKRTASFFVCACSANTNGAPWRPIREDRRFIPATNEFVVERPKLNADRNELEVAKH